MKKTVAFSLLALLLSASNVFADELKDISQLAGSGQQVAALDRINTYLAANPKDAQGLFLKGIILAESGKRDDAIKAFTDLTQKYPNLPEPYNNLAVLYAEAGQYDQAKKSLETAIKTHPSYAIAHENLGDIYARMASEAYDKALQLDGGNSRAQSKLALIKDLFGNKTATAAATPAATSAKADVVAKANDKTAAKTNFMPIRPADKKVEPAKPVEPEKAPVAEPAADNDNDIREAINAWAAAWSHKDLDKYFASYADTFQPAKGQSHQEWEQTRFERISRPTKIFVDVANLQISVKDDSNAKASFKQSYRADGKPIRTDKTLLLKKVNGKWLISQEIASN